jgi:hypothetical protein
MYIELVSRKCCHWHCTQAEGGRKHREVQCASGACMMRNTCKETGARGEFAIGLKRTNEPKGEAFFSLKWSITHTHTFAHKSRSHRPPIAVWFL